MAEQKPDAPSVDADEAWREKYKAFVARMVPYDPRFPNQNQTRNCQMNYVDYHRCLQAKDGDEDYCAWYKNAYRQLCPPEWYEKWDEQRESGTFPILHLNANRS